MWFCNRRQKEKRMLSGALNVAGGLMMSEPGSAASSDLRDDCSAASRSSSGDDIAADDCRNGPTSALYQPPAHTSYDYCNTLQPGDYCPAPPPDSSSPFHSGSTHAPQPQPPPEVGLSSYACAVSGWSSHFRSPQFASLMVAAAGAMLPDAQTAS